MGYFKKGDYTVVPNIQSAMEVLTPVEFKVYVALCTRADANGGCYPSQNTIGKDANASVRTCQRALDTLRERGFISVHQQARNNGSQTSNYYRLLVKGGDTHDVPPHVTGDVPITKPIKNKNPIVPFDGQKTTPAAELLPLLLEIVNPKEKATAERQRTLNARLKDYSDEEILNAARAFSKSQWHIDNKQMSIDNLLAPSKFGRWYADSQGTGKTDAQKEAEYLAKYDRMEKRRGNN